MFSSTDKDVPTIAASAVTALETTSATENGLGCMVIGFSDKRRQLLSSAAAATGMTVVESADPKAARVQLLRNPPALVVLDLEDTSGSAPEALKSLAERVSKQRDLLIAMCGNEGNAREEIWARQLGVWLYLPGVVNDSDLSSLLEEGSQVAARRASSANRNAYFPDGNTASA
jgi:DNA-binding NarL/FixJ family response regulator